MMRVWAVRDLRCRPLMRLVNDFQPPVCSTALVAAAKARASINRRWCISSSGKPVIWESRMAATALSAL
mgnify:CR=1 FL=1